jgi:hypothetical protein
MRGTFKGRSGYVAGAVALLVFGFSLISGLARRIGVVEPHIRIERSQGIDIHKAELAMRYAPVQRALTGEVATTAERLREASYLAAGAAMLSITQKNATAAGVIRRMVEMKKEPVGAVIGDKDNTMTTPYGALVLYHRAAPIGIEVLSLARNKEAGPALIVRIAPGMPDAKGVKIWSSLKLENIQIPQPFSPEAEVIAAGWQAENLPLMK